MDDPTTDSQNAHPDRYGAGRPAVYFAVAPTVLFLFFVAACMSALRPACVEALADFELEPPAFTSWVAALTSTPAHIFLPPGALAAIMLYYAWRRPLSEALCVAVGGLALGLSAVIAFYLAMVLPLLGLIAELSG